MTPNEIKQRDWEIGTREYLEKLLAEKDKLADARFKAFEAALVSQDKATAAAFAASEKAIVKAEDAQKSYNSTHNDLSRKMDEQYKEMIPRSEATALLRGFEDKITFDRSTNESKFGSIGREIASLRESRSEGGGKDKGIGISWQALVSLVGLIVAMIAVFSFINRPSSQVQPTSPQIIYVPAAPGTLIPSAPTQPAPAR